MKQISTAYKILAGNLRRDHMKVLSIDKKIICKWALEN
jgi:hypothetical protein